MKSLTNILLLIFFSLNLFGQKSNVRGTIRDNSGNGISGASIKIIGTDYAIVSDSAGNFLFQNIPFGEYDFEFSGEYFGTVIQQQKIDQSEFVFEKITLLRPRIEINLDVDNNNGSDISENEASASSSQFVSSALTASRDAFVSAASYSFSITRFRMRGYDDENNVTLINGSPMSDLVTGRTPYYTWGGLNDMMRSRNISLGLSASAFSFGDIGGAQLFDT
ncbi:MAG: carboxypeptidase regulatory-like domain-containing protein, partial [Bacteroidia bacterium]|nr:carboxypeptidase regulatory-like domain-containing protein [Bacteroidia bacterium]